VPLDYWRIGCGSVHQHAESAKTCRQADKTTRTKIVVGKGSMKMVRYFLALAALTLSAASSAPAQYACTTNYCISSQSISFQTPPGWPAVSIETCCQTHWGALPGGIDWNNGAPIMICTGRAEYVTSFPNCGDPNNLSQAFPLDYEQPKFAIGVAWPNAKDYRYEMQSVPILDGPDGTCAEYSNRPGQVTNWWVYELKEPKRGSYVFTATVSFQKGEKGYYAVLNSCKLKPPSPTAVN
jgi:hypothetical protein